MTRSSESMEVLSLDDCFADFLNQYYSRNTRRAYRLDWESFLEGLQIHFELRPTRPEHITEALLVAWHEKSLQHIEDLKEFELRRKKQVSLARRVATVSAFARYLFESGFVSSDASGLLRARSRRPSQPKFGQTPALSSTDLQKIEMVFHEKCPRTDQSETWRVGLSSQEQKTKESFLLAKALYTLLLTTGLRIQEALRLNVRQSRSRMLKVQLKGGDQHLVTLLPETQSALNHYLQMVRPEALDDEPLFVRVQRSSSGPRPLTQAGAYDIVRKIYSQAGIEQPLSLGLHSLRATLATQLARSGVSLPDIQTQLGHKHIQTTAKYIRQSQAIQEAAALELKIDERLETD